MLRVDVFPHGFVSSLVAEEFYEQFGSNSGQIDFESFLLSPSWGKRENGTVECRREEKGNSLDFYRFVLIHNAYTFLRCLLPSSEMKFNKILCYITSPRDCGTRSAVFYSRATECKKNNFIFGLELFSLSHLSPSADFVVG